ncbi:hypothetical protein CRENBAI_000100 [Crenichthys baileyi]|uniref:SEA domain-containing protein n=1 Tax=Crenichthys baileyi TaxID=28760 RepID=A0AAV9SSF8_9TELE
MTTTITSATSKQTITPPTSADTSETPESTTITERTTLTVGPPSSSPTSSPPPSSTFPDSSNTPTEAETTTTTLLTTSPMNTTLSTKTPTTEIVTTLLTTGRTTTTSSSTTEAPPPVIVCPSVPCPVQSVCLKGTCQCLSGNYLQDGHCVPAQVFPCMLHFELITFHDQMSDRSSSIFQSTAANISAALRNVLKNVSGYRQSEVVQLKQGSVIASVNNIFENSNATQESVDNIIEAGVRNFTGDLAGATYTATNLCEVEPLPCDVSSTTCTQVKGQAFCSCKEGYISMVYSNISCKACPSGQRAVGNTCQTCPFGYAGFNCNDSSLLAVVVISCVLGGVLLIIVLALLVYCCWRRCSRTKPNRNTSPYSEDLNKSWPITINPIPRANTNWTSTDSIEMAEGGSTNTLVDKKQQSNGFSGSYDLNPEEMKTFKGRNTSRYSYLVEGHENPYFLPGDEKKN